jgi:cell division protein FtsZ
MNITGGADLTLFEVNEAAEIIQQAADPEAEILFGCVHDERLSGLVKVTVIATGFDRADEAQAALEEEHNKAAAPVRPGRAPFLRGDDSGGFGPNASARDDFDIPTVLRRQMD